MRTPGRACALSLLRVYRFCGLQPYEAAQRDFTPKKCNLYYLIKDVFLFVNKTLKNFSSCFYTPVCCFIFNIKPSKNVVLMTKVQHISEQIEKVRIMGRQTGRVLTDKEINAVAGGILKIGHLTWDVYDPFSTDTDYT